MSLHSCVVYDEISREDECPWRKFHEAESNVLTVLCKNAGTCLEEGEVRRRWLGGVGELICISGSVR